MGNKITNEELERIFGASIPTESFWMMLHANSMTVSVEELRVLLISAQDNRDDQGEITYDELSATFPNKIAEKAKEIYYDKNISKGKKRRLFRELAGKRQIIKHA